MTNNINNEEPNSPVIQNQPRNPSRRPIRKTPSVPGRSITSSSIKIGEPSEAPDSSTRTTQDGADPNHGVLQPTSKISLIISSENSEEKWLESKLNAETLMDSKDSPSSSQDQTNKAMDSEVHLVGTGNDIDEDLPVLATTSSPSIQAVKPLGLVTRGHSNQREDQDSGIDPQVLRMPRPSSPRWPSKIRKQGQTQPRHDETTNVSFMHPSEAEFAKLLDYYQVRYLYEPRSFPLRWDGNRVVEMFSPDFYLPEQDQYFELTTMKQTLVTQKNRKLRRVKELYPEINVQLLYRRDYIRLLAKYGHGPMAEADVNGVDRELYSTAQIQKRVQEIGARINHDYANQIPVFVGVLKGVIVFMSDLMRTIELDAEIDFLQISHYGEEGADSVEVVKDVEMDLSNRHVILVEDIVDTGLTLKYLLNFVEGKAPASVSVCTLLDKNVRRVTDVPVEYCGFQIPDEFVVGYGLDYNGLYRNLPYIGILKPSEPKFVPQR